MCRLAAFPPGFPRKEAIDILLEFEKHNVDGTGYSYVQDGRFVTCKWPISLSRVLRRYPFLNHMPYNGWTVAHLRAASHGSNKMVNTHPFIIDNKWAVVHNGIWSEYGVVKLALQKQIQFKGETDSEVAAHLINIAGPKAFAEKVVYGGVFLALNKKGDLWAIKTGGQLTLHTRKTGQTLLASDLDFSTYNPLYEAFVGWYHFDNKGKYLSHKKTTSNYISKWGGVTIIDDGDVDEASEWRTLCKESEKRSDYTAPTNCAIVDYRGSDRGRCWSGCE